MYKFFFILSLFFCSQVMANQSCNKLTLKEYQANPQATFKYQLANDLALKTIVPKQMFLVGGTTVYFDDDRSRYMTYELIHEPFENKAPKQVLLEALGVQPASIDINILKTMFHISHCNQITEIKTNSVNYQVFMVKTERHINVYLVANDSKRDSVHFLQFRGFSADEVGQQLVTVYKGE